MAKLNNAHRLLCGTLVLLVVDVIWVASSEMTKYIFKEENYSKPFFSTYVKTTMFMIYLLGFMFWRPWRDQCIGRPVYTLVDPDNIESDDNEGSYNALEPVLSESVWMPIKFHDGGEKSSGNESDDPSANQRKKAVRFSKVAEVRHLSESQADDALLARLSYAASLRAQENALKAANKLTVKQVAKIALLFCLLWFVGNLSYQEALSNTKAGIVNILSCSSGLFTLILAAVFPANSGDRFTLSKFLAVSMSILGVVVISSTDQQKVQNYFPPGAVWSILGAFFYAAYIVLLRRKVDNEDRIDIPMFFGFVGLFNLVLMWPGFVLLHYTKVEEFQWPSHQQWLLLVGNGLIGTVLSELLWLWGCFLTSSLIATLSVSLTIPLTIFFDIFLKRVDYPLLFYLGTLPMFLSFFAVAFLTHYDNWDPVLLGIQKLVTVCHKRQTTRLRDTDYEQTESLINVNSEYT